MSVHHESFRQFCLPLGRRILGLSASQQPQIRKNRRWTAWSHCNLYAELLWSCPRAWYTLTALSPHCSSKSDLRAPCALTSPEAEVAQRLVQKMALACRLTSASSCELLSGGYKPSQDFQSCVVNFDITFSSEDSDWPKLFGLRVKVIAWSSTCNTVLAIIPGSHQPLLRTNPEADFLQSSSSSTRLDTSRHKSCREDMIQGFVLSALRYIRLRD